MIQTIDAHVAGEAVRLLVGGAPAVAGRTMAEKLAWLNTHGESTRRLLMLEPRGHAGMHGAMLTEPATPRAQAGVLFMHAGGFPRFSGEGVIAAATIARAEKLIEGVPGTLALDTPVGLVSVRPTDDGEMSVVELTGVPSFVYAPGVAIRAGGRDVRVDVAFGGEFYAIVDSESVGVPIDMAHAAELLRTGREVLEAVEAATTVVHPAEKTWTGVQGVIFTAPPRGAADLRTATVLEGDVLRRSPGVAGTCALLAVLDAMGLMTEGQPFTNESLIETTLRARFESRGTVRETPCVMPIVEGAAVLTGRHQFVA